MLLRKTVTLMNGASGWIYIRYFRYTWYRYYSNRK